MPNTNTVNEIASENVRSIKAVEGGFVGSSSMGRPVFSSDGKTFVVISLQQYHKLSPSETRSFALPSKNFSGILLGEGISVKG